MSLAVTCLCERSASVTTCFYVGNATKENKQEIEIAAAVRPPPPAPRLGSMNHARVTIWEFTLSQFLTYVLYLFRVLRRR